MTTGLPTRDFYELAAPDGGALAVRREACRRRRRRALLTSGGTASVLVTTVLLLQVGRATPHDSLQLTDPPTTSPAATPSDVSSPRPRSVSTPPGRVGGSLTPAVRGDPATTPTGEPRAERSAVPEGYRTPDLTRTYTDHATFGTVSVCSGSASSNQNDLQQTVAWCPEAVVSNSARGHDLTGQVCRDGSSDARLTFATRQEVELTVTNEEGTVVWRWSTGHHDAADAHSLDVARDHCWSWTAPWTDVDAYGRPLPSGSYVLEMRSRSDELRTAPVATASFAL